MSSLTLSSKYVKYFELRGNQLASKNTIYN